MHERLDGGYGWFICLGAFLVYTCVIGTVKTSGLLFVYFKEEFNSSYSSTSAISLTQRTCETATALLFSFLAERYGSRPIMIIGSAFMVTGALLSVFATTIAELTVTFGILLGLGSSMLMYPTSVMIPKYFDKNVALASAFALTGGSFGPLILPFAIQWAVDSYGLHGAFFIIAGIYMHAFIGSCLMRPPSFFHRQQSETNLESEKQVTTNLLEPPEIFEEIDPIDPTLSNLSLTDTKIEKEKEIAKKGRKSRLTFKDTLNCYKKCLQHRSLGIYFFAYATAIIAGTMFMVFQQAHVIDVGIEEPHLLALLTTIGGISEILFRVLFAFVIQSNSFAPYRVQQCSSVVLATLLVVYPMFSTFWVLACCAGLVAIIFSAIVVSFIPALRHLVGIDLASFAFGLICIPVLISYALVQVGGVARDYFGSFAPVYYSCAALLLMGVIALEVIAWLEDASLCTKIFGKLSQSESSTTQSSSKTEVDKSEIGSGSECV